LLMSLKITSDIERFTIEGKMGKSKNGGMKF
jgi:hypothetical protein